MRRAEKKAAGEKAGRVSADGLRSSRRRWRSARRWLVGGGCRVRCDGWRLRFESAWLGGAGRSAAWLRRGAASSVGRRVFVEVVEVGFEVGEVFPEEVAAVDDLAAAHVEEVDGEHVVFEVEAEDVGVLVVGGGDALLVLHLVDGDELVAEAGGELELHVFGGGFHAAR